MLEYIISAVDEFSKTFDKAQAKLKSVGDSAVSAGKGMTAGFTLPIVGAAIAVGKASIDFESAFTDVIKTVKATDTQIAALESGIRNMAKELPASAVEIAGVASAAGQLGIQTDNILSFTRVMTDLGNTTNLSADTAATELARLANITGMAQTDFDRLGSTIVSLGNNLATTEAEIVSMAMRLGGAGSTIGLTEAQILGFAGALSSVGIEAEAGGSAFSKLMIDIASNVATGGDKLVDFASTAGMTTEQFAAAFKDNAGGALISFVEGLGKLQSTGGNVFGVLEDLGITEVRMRDALLRASGAGDLFRESLELGSTAWEENNALTAEAELRYGTTASQLSMLWNRITDVAITLGDAMVPALMSVLDAMAPLFTAIENGAAAFAKLDSGTQTLILGAVGLVAILGPALIVFGMVASAISAIGLPVLAVIAVLALLTAAFVYLWNTNEGFREGVIAVWEAIKSAFSTAWAFIEPILIAFGAFILATFTSISAWVSANWPIIRDTITGVFSAIWAFIQPIISAIGTFLHEIFGEVFTWWATNWPIIQETAETVWNAIWTVISFIGNQIWAFLEPLLNLIWDYWKLMWSGVELFVKTAWEAIKLIVRTAIDLVAGIVTTAMQLITGDWKGAWDTMKTTVTNVLGNIWTFIKNTFANAISFFTTLKSRFYTLGSELFNGFKNGIMDAGQRAIDAALAIARKVKEAVAGFLHINSPSRVFMEMGGFVTEGFADGITSGLSGAVSAAKALSSATIGAVSSGSSPSMSASGASVGGGGVNIVINAQYVDRDAVDRFAAEVSRSMGRSIGGKY